jgi:diguanylate cyclase (GGDEF)-like protein/PAS domain S-box-containing protein
MLSSLPRTALRVLLVEDSEGDAALLVRHLERGGYDVDVQRVECAEEMNEALGQRGWDIVISDYNLPHFDAPQALATLQASGKDLPFVVVSGNMGEDIAVAMMRDGAHDYLLKSDLARLAPAIRREVREADERRRSNEELQLAASVFHGTRECLAVTDAERRVISVNKAFSHFTGWSLEDVIHRTPSFMERSETADGDMDDAWIVAEATGFWQGEVFFRLQSGESRPHWLSISAVRDNTQQLTHFICSSNDVTASKTAEQQIQYLAHYDVLTGLPNRVLFQERIEHALAAARRYNDVLAVLFLDLDRFKNINDTLGHPVGDLLLKSVAQRLAVTTRTSDTVARLGGDEFVVVLTRTSVEGATKAAEKFLHALEEPHRLDAHVLTISASIGISIFPEDGTDVDTLVKHADTALYHAKDRGRNSFQFFTADLNRRAYELVQLESALRQAVERNEFRLAYQPRIDVATGAITGAEALLRWQHPSMGCMMPDRFIWVAEDTGLIEVIGEWVLRETCAQNARWQAAGLPAIPIAVNVSAHQFRNRNFVGTVERALADADLDPQYLELELTEGIVMQDADTSIRTMQALHALNVVIAIDDFGTGHSSLSYIKRLPLTHLKIDRSFLSGCPADESDSAIVKAVIGLAHTLRLRVVAEGVEHLAQLEFLQAHGCDSYQGFLYSKPVPPIEFEAMVRAASGAGGAATAQIGAQP